MTEKKVCLVTGITGQDGSYLAELLLDKGYEVHGIIRRTSSFNTERIEHIFPKLILHHGDLLDSSGLNSLLAAIKPVEIYNLAAMSHVKVSFDIPEYTAEATGVGTLRILEAIRSAGLEKTCRFYQASTSELFGLVQEIPQKETTPFYPRSPYGVAKLYAHWITKNFREAYEMYCVSGILFNHESPRRGKTFVTRKITVAVARILAKKQNSISLGNLDALRDWGHARDYVEAMWLMLQQDVPEDYVVATGEQHSVREFCELAFAMGGKRVVWNGASGIDEKGLDEETGAVVIEIDTAYFRPAEVETLLGDPSKAERELGWRRKVAFKDLVYDMMQTDCQDFGITLPPREECLARAEKILAINVASPATIVSTSTTNTAGSTTIIAA